MAELIHICEVCGLEQVLMPDDAFDEGWDYPPRMGVFGILSPRTCPQCPMGKTLWWQLQKDGDMQLTPEQMAFVERVNGEPGSITPRKA